MRSWNTSVRAASTPWAGSSSTRSDRWNHRPGEQQTLELATGQGRDRRIAQPIQSHGGERGVDVLSREAPGQRRQTAQVERQIRTDLQALRHIADLERRRSFDDAPVDFDQAENRLGKGRLARTVGADQVDQLAAENFEVDLG